MPNNNVADFQWVMAFDFGEFRIGVAIGNTLLKIPHPIATITGRNKFEKLDKIKKLVEEWQPKQFVVGMPSQIENKEKLVSEINRFSNRIKHKFNLPCMFINEDYSSSIASSKLNAQNIRGAAQKSKLDQLAACEILRFYFNLL